MCWLPWQLGLYQAILPLFEVSWNSDSPVNSQEGLWLHHYRSLTVCERIWHSWLLRAGWPGAEASDRDEGPPSVSDASNQATAQHRQNTVASGVTGVREGVMGGPVAGLSGI